MASECGGVDTFRQRIAGSTRPAGPERVPGTGAAGILAGANYRPLAKTVRGSIMRHGRVPLDEEGYRDESSPGSLQIKRGVKFAAWFLFFNHLDDALPRQWLSVDLHRQPQEPLWAPLQMIRAVVFVAIA